SDPDLNAANLSVDVNSDKNEVKLSGTVPTENLRTKAVEIAKAIQPGATVTDKIDVKPKELTRADYTEEMARSERDRSTGDKIGTSLDDAWIHSKITTKLIGNSDTPARKINVDVSEGVVTLRGTVDSATAKDEASRIAKETDGVKRVSNLLR